MLNEIEQEILIIPNQDGMIFGPGGVGKTALLIELSQRLFDHVSLAGDASIVPHFDNIIWVSAKQDFYDPIRGVTEAYTSDITSLDSVLSAVLAFHGILDGDDYSKDDKIELATELFRESATLLIIDNLESIGPHDQDEIIRFFAVSVKQRLRTTPDRLKVLVTSREERASGFHQFEVTGLDEEESRQLMHRLYGPYKHSGSAPLTPAEEMSVHRVCHGIPLVIMHCFGQYYEFKRDLQSVLKSLSNAGSNIVEFSFAEVLRLLRQDRLQLKILLLLGIATRPLTLAHLTDLLGATRDEVEIRIGRLYRFRCAVQLASGNIRTNTIGDEARPLVMALMTEFSDVTLELKRGIASLPIEKRLNYSEEELRATVRFKGFVASSQYMLADDIMARSLADFPQSVILTLAYADYLIDVKNRPQDAMDRCEAIRRSSGNDILVLSTLLKACMALPEPPFESGLSYAKELENITEEQSSISIQVARFYIFWSTTIRLRPLELDPNKEVLRQQRYKELADAGAAILNKVRGSTHERSYLLAQANLNKWDYGAALLSIEAALRSLPAKSHLMSPYLHLKDEITRKRDEEELKRRSKGRRRQDW
jgi:hypothetical protein